MADEIVRFEIGFRGGGSTGGMALVGDWERLEAALRDGTNASVELRGNDQRWVVRVDEVAWTRRHEGERRLGFTG